MTQMSGPSGGRPRLRKLIVDRLGGIDGADAIRIATASRFGSMPSRKRDALIGHLEGKGIPELMQDLDIGEKMVRILIDQALVSIERERSSMGGPNERLMRLSNQSRSCLASENLRDDAAVVRHVEENGARSLRRVPNLGIKAFSEICDAFDFDPDAPAFATAKPESASSPAQDADASRGAESLRGGYLRRVLMRAAGEDAEPVPSPDDGCRGPSI
jgi:hypothetical protein